MSDFIDLTGGKSTVAVNVGNESELITSAPPTSNVPSYDTLQSQLAEASLLVDDIVLKNYLTKLTELDIIPLPDNLKQISDIRLFKINEMVYQNDEYSTYKFASVFNSVQNLNCGVFIIADSDGQRTDFYMGVRALDDKRTTKSLKDTLRNALRGQFLGLRRTIFSTLPQSRFCRASSRRTSRLFPALLTTKIRNSTIMNALFKGSTS